MHPDNGFESRHNRQRVSDLIFLMNAIAHSLGVKALMAIFLLPLDVDSVELSIFFD